MRVLHVGTFDVDNFGDLLYPLVVQRRLAAQLTSYTAASPIGGPPVWADCAPVAALGDIDPDDVDVVIVGGGNILHTGPAGVPQYRSSALHGASSYVQLWYGAARVATQAGAPLLFLGCGVPRAFSLRTAPVMRACLEAASMVVARDQPSRQRLLDIGIQISPQVAPDLACDVLALWTPEELIAARSAAFEVRGVAEVSDYLAVQLNHRYLGESVEEVARRLDRLSAATGRPVVLVATGPCHGDDVLARAVGSAMESAALVIDYPVSLREVVAVLAGAGQYAGSSLHGGLTALMAGVPVTFVARAAEAGDSKQDGALRALGLKAVAVADWTQVDEAVLAAAAASRAHVQPAARMAALALEGMWRDVDEVLKRPVDASRRDLPPLPIAALSDALEDAERAARRDTERAAIAQRELTAAAAAAEQRSAAREGELRRHRDRLEQLQTAMAQASTATSEARRQARVADEGAREAAARATAAEARVETAEAKAEAALEQAAGVRRAAELRIAEVDVSLAKVAREKAALDTELRREKAARLSAEKAAEEAGVIARQMRSALVRAHGDLVVLHDQAVLVRDSRAWRFGHVLMRLLRRVTLRRPHGLGGAERMVDISEHGRARACAELEAPVAARASIPATSEPRVTENVVESAVRDEMLAARRVLDRLPALVRVMCEDGIPRDTRRVIATSEDASRIGVVVCVHDALADVERCLRSLLRVAGPRFELTLVNDGSDGPTTDYLRRFVEANPSTVLVENLDGPNGYTRAANLGLRASETEFTVLLNSDTVVTSGWLDGITTAFDGDARIGVVGVLSNAATHQSVPRVKHGDEWAINDLPDWLTTDGMAAVVRAVAGRHVVEVPFVNGFCFAIRRSVIEKIGVFDEELFAEGYSEENDFCRRAADAGFVLGIVPSVYVFHAKSRSYGHADRKLLAKRHYARFLERHGEERVRGLVAEMTANPELASIRGRIGEALASPAAAVRAVGTPSVAFVLPGMSAGGSGGTHSVFQEAQALREIGVDARIAVPDRVRDRVRTTYGDTNGLFVDFPHADALGPLLAGTDVVVATHHSTVENVRSLVNGDGAQRSAYYVQDYEPLFHDTTADTAAGSYTAIRGQLFAKTDWLCAVVEELHGVPVARVEASIDRAVYGTEGRTEADIVRVAAMARPRTPRRAARATIEVLRRVEAAYGDRVRISLFGCDDAELDALGPPVSRARNHGLLARQQVGDLLRDTDVFLDASWFQAFGRTGLEAMACGATAVLPMLGGCHEYAQDEWNALLVDSLDLDAIVAALSRLIEDRELRTRLQGNATATGARFSSERAAVSEAMLLAEHLGSASPLLARGRSSRSAHLRDTIA